MSQTYTLAQLNTMPVAEFVQVLGGIYEHSPWFAEAAATQRPFADAAALAQALRSAVDDAGEAAQLKLVRAHPELAGKEDFVTLSFKLYNQYVYGGQKVLGEMDEARLAALQDFYAKEGFIRSKTPVKDLYTNQFVK